MKLNNTNVRYRVRPGQKEPGDMHSYHVEEWDGSELLRSFPVVISESQRLTHAPAESDIERWCEVYFEKLPTDGSQIRINLDEVRTV